jgi:hypothetical protein
MIKSNALFSTFVHTIKKQSGDCFRSVKYSTKIQFFRGLQS